MSQSKWSTEEIEALLLQLNQLQQQLEQYQGVKKLGKAFAGGALGGLRTRFTSKAVGTVPTSQFFSSNPNFKPYSIRLTPPPTDKPLPKILHVIPVFTTGGSQQLIVDLIEGLSGEYVHEVAVRNKHLEQGYIGVPVHHYPFLQDGDDFKAQLAIVRPNIVHVHYWGQWKEYVDWKWYHSVFEGSIAYGCRVVENCNNPLMPYLRDGIDQYVYVSQYARDTFGVRSLPNQVIYPGSNFSFFTRANSIPDPDTIGMVYRLDKDKLNDFSIDPLIKAVQQRPGTKALVVGGGHYLELFQQKVAAAGVADSFTFTGYVAYETLAGYYRQMAIFVAPVHKESFGQVTPFAMNMGIPVVAYNVGALEEMLVDGSVLAPAQDSDAMANIIVELLENPARRAAIGAYNQARATELFSVETMVAAYGELYKALC